MFNLFVLEKRSRKEFGHRQNNRVRAKINSNRQQRTQGKHRERR